MLLTTSVAGSGLSLGANTELHMAVVIPLGLLPNITHLNIRVVDESFDTVMWNVFWGGLWTAKACQLGA